MSWAELEQLRDAGWEIASHTRSHPRLPQLDDEALAEELTGSRALLRELLGEAGRTLAYPYGDEDGRVRRAARAAGYEAAAGLRPGPPSRWCWPRVGIYPVDGPGRFRIKTSPLVRRTRATGLVRRLERARYSRRRQAS
jgi:peptidoglycan/xylan/chitin deacetylase (PgdA/CDA1 family)